MRRIKLFEDFNGDVNDLILDVSDMLVDFEDYGWSFYKQDFVYDELFFGYEEFMGKRGILFKSPDSSRLFRNTHTFPKNAHQKFINLDSVSNSLLRIFDWCDDKGFEIVEMSVGSIIYPNTNRIRFGLSRQILESGVYDSKPLDAYQIDSLYLSICIGN